jgi:hypothetical protein
MPPILKNTRVLIGVAIVLVLFIAIGMWLASGGSRGPSGETKVETTVTSDTVTYADNDTLVSESIANRIAKVESDKLVFDGNVNVSSLPVGKPLMFPGKAVRRIREVKREGGKTVIYTDKANLNEVIKDADLKWNQGFNFSQMAKSDLEKIKPMFGGTALAQTESSGNSLHFEGEIEGWDIEVDLSPNSAQSRLDVTIDATKGGQARSRIHADGYISNFVSQGSLAYADSELQQFGYQEEGLNGRLHVIFAAVDLGSDTPLFNIPAEIAIPYNVGPIFMQAKLKANVRVVPEVHGLASSQADVTVTYSADRGFNFEGGRVTPVGQLDDQNIAITGETVSAGTIAVGMGVGIEFPRLELAIMGETVVPYMSLDNYTYTVYTPDPPCQEGGMRQRAVIGLTAGFLGYSYSQETEIWKREQITELPNSHCGPRN